MQGVARAGYLGGFYLDTVLYDGLAVLSVVRVLDARLYAAIL